MLTVDMEAKVMQRTVLTKCYQHQVPAFVRPADTFGSGVMQFVSCTLLG